MDTGTMRKLGALGLLSLAVFDLAGAGGFLTGEGLGPSTALAREQAGPEIADVLPETLATLLVAAAAVLALGAVRLVRGARGFGIAVGAGSLLSFAAFLAAVPATQIPAALYFVLLSWFVLANSAQKARPVVGANTPASSG